MLIVFVSGTEAEPSPAARFEALIELPPSAKLVYTVLETEGRCTQSQLADETLLSPRTTRQALSELKSARLVEEEVYIPDARKKLYRSRLVERGD